MWRPSVGSSEVGTSCFLNLELPGKRKEKNYEGESERLLWKAGKEDGETKRER